MTMGTAVAFAMDCLLHFFRLLTDLAGQVAHAGVFEMFGRCLEMADLFDGVIDVVMVGVAFVMRVVVVMPGLGMMGVVVMFRSLQHFVCFAAELFRFFPVSLFIQPASLAFDLFGPLAYFTALGDGCCTEPAESSG